MTAAPAADTRAELAGLRDRLAALEQRVAGEQREERVAIVCFSGEWDRLYAAFTLATGALASGMQADVFLTFWGAAALRDSDATPTTAPRRGIERLLARLLPGGTARARLSRLHWFGLGRRLFDWRMRRRGTASLDELIQQTRELGGRVHLCETSADLLGLHPDEYHEHGDVDRCGAASFLRDAARGRLSLFV